jgi:hypothetical protein
MAFAFFFGRCRYRLQWKLFLTPLPGFSLSSAIFFEASSADFTRFRLMAIFGNGPAQKCDRVIAWRGFQCGKIDHCFGTVGCDWDLTAGAFSKPAPIGFI